MIEEVVLVVLFFLLMLACVVIVAAISYTFYQLSEGREITIKLEEEKGE